jgi:hypothetical protein
MQEASELSTDTRDPLTGRGTNARGGDLASRIKSLLPHGLFGRSALLLAAPLIISQRVGTGRRAGDERAGG